MKRESGAPAAESESSRRATLYALFVVGLALVLRLYRLGAESFWIDEGFSLRDTLNLNLLGETRPLYFLFLRAWTDLFGVGSEFMLRLPSAIFGAAGVWVLYAIGRRLFDTRVALLASAFMAISVLHINHSREARMYSLAVLLALLSTYFLILSLERKRAAYAVSYAVSSLAGLLAYPLTLLVLAAHGLFLLMYLRAYRRWSPALIGCQAAVLAIWVPWLFNNMQASTGYGEGYTSIIDKPTPAGVLAFLGRFFLWKWSDPGRLMVIGAFIFSAIILLTALRGMREFRRTDTGLMLSAFWLAVPIAGLIVVSYTMSNMWMVHYLIPASPPLFLMVAKGVFSIRRRLLAAGVLMVIFTLTMGRLGLYYRKHVRPEWKTVVSFIQEHERPGDVIGLHYAGNQYVFRYYYDGRSGWATLGGDEITREHFFGWNDERVAKRLSEFPLTGKRFWLVLSLHDYAGGPVIVNYMEKNYRVLEHRYYSQIELMLVEADGRPVPLESRRITKEASP